MISTATARQARAFRQSPPHQCSSSFSSVGVGVRAQCQGLRSDRHALHSGAPDLNKARAAALAKCQCGRTSLARRHVRWIWWHSRSFNAAAAVLMAVLRPQKKWENRAVLYLSSHRGCGMACVTAATAATRAAGRGGSRALIHVNACDCVCDEAEGDGERERWKRTDICLYCY